MDRDVEIGETTVVDLDSMLPSNDCSILRGPKPTRTARSSRPESIDRFAIRGVIGRGGMGELYVGWDDRLDRKVAIKLVHSHRHSEAAEQRLLREAKVLGQLSHPNVVSVFEVGHFNGRVFVAMEFVEGVTLRRWLRQLEATGIGRTQAILACFAAAGRGLAAVHAAGLAHRDVKPENVLVGADGRVRIVDFGLARSLHETCEEELDRPQPLRERASTNPQSELFETPTLTEDGALLGTPRYIAPEQWLGRRGDAHSDQFSFCVTLYEALFDTQPFAAASVEELSSAVQSGRLRSMPRRAEVPLHVREALRRGLSVSPSDRFPSMDALLEALLPSPSRRPWVLAGIALTLLSLALASAVLFWSRGQVGARSLDGSTFAKLQRELVAAEHLARAEAQIEALSEAGSFKLADVVFHDFAELPDHAGSSALARGWLRQAERLERRGELEAELDAYAAAYVSEFLEHQQRALFGLARAFHRTRQWLHLGATLGTLGPLDTRGPLEEDPSAVDLQRRAELRAMQVTVLASRRDLLGAARVLGLDDERTRDDAILRAALLELGRARLTELDLDGSNLVLAELAGLDLDGDEVGELLVAKPGAEQASLTVLGTASAQLDELGQLELESQLQLGGRRERAAPIADPRTLMRDGQAFVAVRRGTMQSLHRITRTGTELEAELLGAHEQDGNQPASWALADLDRDHALELYLGLQAPRRLLGLELPHERWFDPHPATNAANSVIYGLEAGDLDGDGDEELAVVASEWSAYDLRIFSSPSEGAQSGGAQSNRLQLLGRRKLGAVQSIASLPAGDGRGRWIALGVADMYPSERVFSAAAPSATPGLHLLAWDGARIAPLESWPLPGPSHIFTGDFDGNGLHDLALALRSAGQYECVLLLQIHAGLFRALPIRKLWPVGVIDIDRDDDDELLVIDADTARDNGRPRGHLYVLGSGAQQLPVLADAPTPREHSDAARVLRSSSEDPALRGAISRAENLASIGLTLRAANSLSALARVADERLAAHLHVRAAELFASRGHRLEAAHLYARALAKPTALAELRRSILARAIELYAKVHRFEQATELAAAALGRGAGLEEPQQRELAAEHQRLHALANEAPRMVFDFGSPLDEHWWIDPLAVRRQHGRLELDLGGAEQGVVARRELDWQGGRLGLAVELEVDTLEWSGGISIELRPLDHPNHEPLDVGVSSWGGGGIYRLQLRCADGGQHEPGSHGWPFALPHAQLPIERRRFELAAEYVVGDGVWCSAAGEGLQVESPLASSFPPGRYELVIRGSSYAWSRAKASIERIVIIGGREIDRPRTPVDARGRLGRELAEGRAESVLATLDRAEPLPTRERALLRFLALDELGHWQQAELALAEALGLLGRRGTVLRPGDCRRDPATARTVGQLLRHRPERHGPTLRDLCRPDDYFPLLFEVWAIAIHQHPDDDVVARLLITQTAGLERWLPTTPGDRLAALMLLRARARAWAATHGSARSELERAVELASAWLAELDPRDEATRAPLAVELALSRTDLAAQLFDRGEEQRASELLRLALRSSPTPEILADMLVIDERFAGLRERPIWRELVEPARAGRTF